MRLKRNILFAGIGLLIALTLTISWKAVVDMNHVARSSSKENLSLSLKDKIKEIQVKYDMLHETGLDEIKSYVDPVKTALIESYEDFSYKKSGYLFVIKPDNKYIFKKGVKPGSKSSVPQVIKLMSEEKEGITSYTIDDTKRMSTFYYFEPWDWIIGISISEKELYQESTSFLLQVSLIAIISLLISAVILYFLLTVFVEKPILKSVESINVIADNITKGRLDTRANEDDVSSDFRQLASSVNHLIDSFVEPINLVAEYIDRISKGSLPPRITGEYRGDFNEIKNNINRAIDSVDELIQDAEFLTNTAKNENFDVRADETKHQGAYRDIISGFHNTLDLIIDKMHWYEQILDSIPFLISVTDKDMNWTFINKAGTDVIGIDRSSMKDKKCNYWNTEICNTPDCSIQHLKNGNPLAEFTNHSTNKDYKATTNELLDLSGKVMGYIEVIQDVTRENHKLKYDKAEVERLAENLEKLAMGDMALDTKIASADQHTEKNHERFSKINQNLDSVRVSLEALITDSKAMISSVLKGKLDNRANPEKHNGAYKDVVKGFNQLTDAFVEPFVVTAEYLSDIADGRLPELVSHEYKGDFNDIKRSVNRVIQNLGNFINKMKSMYEQQKAGDMDALIDLSDFEGMYKEMADGVNKNVEMHVGNIFKILNTVESYAKGDFSVVLEQLPGKQGVANDYINRLLDNLLAVSNEIERLIVPVRNGDLTHRGDNKKFTNDWSKMISGLNDLLDEIVNPILEAMEVMKKLSNKDLTARMTNNYKGQVDEFKEDINKAGTQLEEALSQVDNAVIQITSAVDEISGGSQSLAEGTSEQASSLEEVSASLEQMNSLTLTNTDNAKNGASLSEEAIFNVERGDSAMKRMFDAMTAISKSAEETGKIIKTIDEIAFQTNLLALNAAVEAAHAGEAGKGFAVVAEEVKNLAMRSAEAARNTNGLIEESMKNSENGGKIVADVSASFTEIRNSFEKVNTIVKEISAASDEQAQGITQVNTAISELNRLTQRNAANAEESASAAEELSSQSMELKEMVAEFTLNGSNGITDRRKSGYSSSEKSILSVEPVKIYEVDAEEQITVNEDFDDF